MNNYKLEIQYDGTSFAGWQMQKNAKTVQAEIKDKIELLLKEEVNIIGSGRTDTGVHALGQIANFKTDKDFDLRKFTHSLNAILPRTISIISLEKVEEDFHARFDAKSRSYIYFFSLVKSPFLDKYSWLHPVMQNIDIEKLNRISSHLLGKHDFTSFSKTKSETKNKICTIKSIRWRKSKNLVIFYIEANRFLHGMVRTIIGTLLDAYEKENPEDFLGHVLEAKDRKAASNSVKAKGLFLYKVKY
jgi:tRNA pseudouridine38-40 synthase